MHGSLYVRERERERDAGEEGTDLACKGRKNPQWPYLQLEQLNQMHIRINISGKRRPEKACYKQRSCPEIYVRAKKLEEKNNANLPHINGAKKKRERERGN